MTRVPAPPDTDLETALAWYRAELNERLVVHWTGGAWRVPLATRHLEVAAADGSRLGRIVCAEGPDVARALSALQGAAQPPGAERLNRLLAPHAALLARLRALEGAAGDGWDPAAAARVLEAEPLAAGLVTPGPMPHGPVTLLSAAGHPVSDLAGRLAALSARGVLWKPAPRAAASAHLLMRALAPLAGPSVALLQGDHASGAMLAQAARPRWLGPGPMPGQLAAYSRGQDAVPQAIFGSSLPSALSSRRP